MVAELWSVQFSSAQDRIQQRTEHIVDALDKKLTDSLWAVTRNRDKETRQTRVTRVKSEKLIDKVQNEIVQLVEDGTVPSSEPAWHVVNTAEVEQPDSIHRAGRSQSDRQEVQRWIGHEPATNHCETVPNHHEDCAEKESVHPQK